MVELASVEIQQAISQGGSQSSDTLTFGQGTNAAINGTGLVNTFFIHQTMFCQFLVKRKPQVRSHEEIVLMKKLTFKTISKHWLDGRA